LVKYKVCRYYRTEYRIFGLGYRLKARINDNYMDYGIGFWIGMESLISKSKGSFESVLVLITGQIKDYKTFWI